MIINVIKPYLCYSLILVVLTTISGCATVPTANQRQNTLQQLADEHGWQTNVIQTSQFDLMSAHISNMASSQRLTIYIEGDGLAWLTKNTLSNDPTPIVPIGLELAVIHDNGNVAYLARPCQYTGGLNARSCSTSLWSEGRFSESVVAAMSEAVDLLKQQYKATELRLIGFSGGGAVATLLAARRDDVTSLVTVAGNLDHVAWTAHHRISPLSDSLNPVDYVQSLNTVNQVHFVGSDDQVVPPLLAQQFIAQLPANSSTKLVIVDQQSHSCCWSQLWQRLLSTHVD